MTAHAIAAACLPWPWMVVGSAVDADPCARVACCANRPVLTYWLGAPPAGLPSHARCFDRPAALLDAIRRACTANVGGMRLAPGSGVELEDGTLLRGATLESLVAAYPSGFALPARNFRAVSDALARHDTGWAPQRDGAACMTLVQVTAPVAAMRANPEVLILEDDAETLDELQNHFTRKRFHPLGARSASRALSLLENNRYSSRPVLAIIDWDLGKAPDRSASSGDVLSRLARELRECPVIVYSQNIDAFNVRSQIQRSHPRALLHDKRDGDASLLERIDRMLDRTVGDLRIHDGTVVVHLPTLDQHHHREAIRLVVHHPDIVTFHSDTATKAVRRFGEWLHEPQLGGAPRESRQSQIPSQRDRDRGVAPDGERVNLSLAEIAELPLAAALVDAVGRRGRPNSRMGRARTGRRLLPGSQRASRGSNAARVRAVR